ncbi:MAG: hypothetical protein LUQ01_00980 [Methanolinea sp.]|nr:hypothetical protein [Methanolinea sp.]
MPLFLKTPEEWLTWILGGECNGHATRAQLSERTGFSESHLEMVLRNLEGSDLVGAWRKGGKIEDVRLTSWGRSSFLDLKERSGEGWLK